MSATRAAQMHVVKEAQRDVWFAKQGIPIHRNGDVWTSTSALKVMRIRARGVHSAQIMKEDMPAWIATDHATDAITTGRTTARSVPEATSLLKESALSLRNGVCK